MSISLDCPTCGRQLRLGDEHAGKRARCPACDSTFPVPDNKKPYGIALDVADVEVDSGPKSGKRKARRAAPEPGSGDKPCPNCGASLLSKAVLCIDCGYDFRLQGQREMKSRLFEHAWDGGIGMVWRLIGMAALIGVCFIFGAFLAAIGRNLLWLPVAFVVLSALFVLLMGSFATFRLERTERGKTLLTRTQWLAFIPVWNTVVDLRKFERILIDHHAGFNMMGWAIFAGVSLVLLPLGGCPGFFWWYWALTHSNYAVLLENPRKDRLLEVYHAWSDVQMRELVDLLKELTDLPISRK